MARQKTYANDPTVTGGDRLTGLRLENGATANYTIDDIAQYMAESGNSDGSRLGFRYTNEGIGLSSISAGHLKFSLVPGASITSYSWSDINAIHVRKLSHDNNDFGTYESILQHSIIKITTIDTPSDRSHALYRVTSVTQNSSQDNVLDLAVTLINNTAVGSIGTDLVVSKYSVNYGIPDELDLSGVQVTETSTLSPGSDANAAAQLTDAGEINFQFGIPEGYQGVGIASITENTNEETRSTEFTITFVNPDPDGPTPAPETFEIPHGNDVASVTYSGGASPGDTTEITFVDEEGNNLPNPVTVQPGVQGYQGISVADVTSRVVGSGDSEYTEITITFSDPSGATPPNPVTFDLQHGDHADDPNFTFVANHIPFGQTPAAPVVSGVYPNLTVTFEVVDGEKGDQGVQGIGIDTITGTNEGVGTDTTVTVTLNDPSGDTTPEDQTFTVPAGATGDVGPGYSDVVLNSDDTLTFTGSGGNSDYTSGSLRGPAFLDISEGDDSETGVTHLTIAGSGVTLTGDGAGNATLTFHGGGGGSQTPASLGNSDLSVTNFNAQEFSNMPQNITVSATPTAHDATINYVRFTGTGISGNADDSSSPYQVLSEVTGSFTINAVANYTLPGESATDTGTATISGTANKPSPTYSPTVTYSGFNKTPNNGQIEAWDNGTITVPAPEDNSINGWTITNLSNDGDTSVTAAESGDVNINVTATATQTSPPPDETAETRSVTLDTESWSRIKSVRVGGKAEAAFTATDIQDLDTYGDDIDFGITNPDGMTFTLTRDAGEYFYIAYDTDLKGLNLGQTLIGALPQSGNWIQQNTDTAGFQVWRISSPGPAVSESDSIEITIALQS